MIGVSQIELGYIVGLFIGYGYSYHSVRDRHYRVEFCFNSKRDVCIMNRAAGILKRLGLTPFVVKDKRVDAVYLRVNSKWLFDIINKEYKRFT